MLHSVVLQLQNLHSGMISRHMSHRCLISGGCCYCFWESYQPVTFLTAGLIAAVIDDNTALDFCSCPIVVGFVAAITAAIADAERYYILCEFRRHISHHRLCILLRALQHSISFPNDDGFTKCRHGRCCGSIDQRDVALRVAELRPSTRNIGIAISSHV